MLHRLPDYWLDLKTIIKGGEYMETTIIDFTKPSRESIALFNKNNSLKGKDFSSTLESLNKKNNNNIYTENNPKTKETNNLTKSKMEEGLKETKETKAELPTEEDEKEENKVVYGNMVYFFNPIVSSDESHETNEEIQPLSNEVNVEGISVEENSEHTLELNSQNIEVATESKGDLATTDGSEKEVNRTEFNHTNLIKETLDHNKESKLIHGDIPVSTKILQNETHGKENEEATIANDGTIVTPKESDMKINMSSEKDSGLDSSLLEKKSDSAEVEKPDEIIETEELQDKSFVSIDKNGIRFIKDNVVRLDKPETINQKEIVEQIVDKVKIDLSNIKNEIKIKLKPEVLGEMTMNIEVIKGAVTAKIMVDNQRTKEIIEANLIQLKEGVKDTGLEIKTFEVFVGSNSDFDKHESGQFNLKQNNKRLKIKPQDNKKVTGYNEQPIESPDNYNINSENSLNILA